MRALFSLLCSVVPLLLWAQRSDTLRFRSAAFGTEREVVVHLPEFHRLASDQVRMPVFILLDGQHEWFIDPLLNDIRFLQYTHQVPQAIVVTVPHVDRVVESAPDSITQPTMPLLELLTKELPPLLRPYDPGDVTVLVGHSFTASFALYAYLAAPDSFDAVIALSPLHLVERSLPLVADRLQRVKDERVLHSAQVERTNTRLLFREFPSAGHTSLPIIAFPDLLATLFTPYALRDSLAAVDGNYKVVRPPPSPAQLVQQLEDSWAFLDGTLPWDLAEANGLLSRLEASGYMDHVEFLLRRIITLYPNDYYFHVWLGQVLLERDPVAARASLLKAREVQDRHAREEPDYEEMKAEIEGMLK
ncbi:MAG: esterase family protein [Flavobacteriales bacterium]|nr:esterase family protein [Flavobacteriales bacterium]